MKPEVLACGEMPSTRLVKGEQANVCIKIGAYYMSYKAPVDQMSLLSVKKGFGNPRFQLSDVNTSIPINIQVGHASPYEVDPTQPTDADNQFRADKFWISQDPVDQNVENPPPPIVRVVPYFTAIIQLLEGVVTGIVWDDGCYGCSSTSADCVKGFCTVQHDNCYINTTTADASTLSDCDPKIYIGWQGSDAKKNIMISSELVPSKFIRYSAGNALNNIRSYTGGLKDQQDV